MSEPESNERREAGSPEEQGVLDVLPAIAKVAATVWVRAAARGVEGSLSLGSRFAHAARNPGEAADLVSEVSDGLRSYAREFLGVSDLDDRVKQLAPPGSGLARGERTTEIVLRKQGAELLRQAADVDHEDGAHPAYARIIGELAPDEARILRLLAIDGAQPSVDVRSGNLIGMGSQLVSSGLNMIGPQAGVRNRDKVPAYLNNLYRLGLIWFSHEPLEDPVRYQVLEAQPEVLAAIKETTRTKTVQRSIHLTPFGQDFCEVCLPLDIEELEELTAGGQPVDV
jgi:Abortive infection alpha